MFSRLVLTSLICPHQAFKSCFERIIHFYTSNVLKSSSLFSYLKSLVFHSNSYSGACGFQEPIGRLIGADNYYMDMYEIQMKDGRIYDYADGVKYYPYNDIYPKKKCKFMGLTCWCPNNPLTILKANYGSRMEEFQPKFRCKDKKWIEVKF